MTSAAAREFTLPEGFPTASIEGVEVGRPSGPFAVHHAAFNRVLEIGWSDSCSSERSMHPPSTVRPLAPSLSVHEIADACREAAVAFLNGAHTGWGKSELAAWLLGPYARATTFVRRAGFDRFVDDSRTAQARVVCPSSLASVMIDARCEVIATIASLERPEEGVTFAFSAINHALITRCRDELGDAGWAPFPPERLRLADRLLGLVAVDYLARPLDYEDTFAVCTTCGAVAFDATARARGLCRSHSVSGIRFNEHDTAPFELTQRRNAG
jgi:hypothetical protein